MAVETERKFLVLKEKWKDPGNGIYLKQGYLSTLPENTVRVRIDQKKGYLTLKGKAVSITRSEFEYEIPLKDAEDILDELAIKPLIEKIRFKIEYGNFTWEVDKFLGENEGLMIAEIELNDAEKKFEKPSWAGSEVSGDTRYYNANLVGFPYKKW